MHTTKDCTLVRSYCSCANDFKIVYVVIMAGKEKIRVLQLLDKKLSCNGKIFFTGNYIRLVIILSMS